VNCIQLSQDKNGLQKGQSDRDSGERNIHQNLSHVVTNVQAEVTWKVIFGIKSAVCVVCPAN
jgi:hypothetical protein